MADILENPTPQSNPPDPQVDANTTDSVPASDIEFAPAAGTSPYGEEDDLFNPIPLTEEEIQAQDSGNYYQLTEEEIQAQDNPFNEEAAITQGFAQQARQQQVIAQQRKNPNNGDWRVKLRLAPGANYLYKDPNAATGILQPLSVTDGVVFPYTPTIDTQYRANYSTYDLTHSNYRGYFYQNSYVDAINISGLFTAQSTPEANYLLAVIHFFRSVTKMFYGQDAQRGTPPPLTYLSGLGEYQFNEHPCLVSNFSYKLPNDVDYVRAGSPNMNNSVNLTWARDKKSTVGGGLLGNLLGGALTRLRDAKLPKGGIEPLPPPPTLGLDRPTYVPTKMEISITLLPVQSRAQVSKQFSVKQFANGDLLKGGFW